MRWFFVAAAVAMFAIVCGADPPEKGWLAQRQIQERQRAAEKIKAMEQRWIRSTKSTNL